MGVKAGYDAAKERCKEEIELLKFLLPANSGNIEKDLIFLALHRGYKQQKAARALSRETIALVKEATAQKRGKDYEEKVWRDLCGAKELNEWPLRPYGDSLHTLTGNMSRVADYIKILKAEMDAYPQIKEASFGQKINNMLSKGGDWLEDITKGIGAIISEWRGIKKEEDKKIEQRAGQPADNSFTPTPFDLSVLTNSAEAKKVGADNSVTDTLHMENLQKVFRMFNIIETKFNTNLNITSGYRTKSTVEALIAAGYSASKKSDHLEGLAMDFALPADKHCELMKFLRENYSDTISQAISYIEAKSPNGNDPSYFHIAIGATKSTKQFASHIGRNNFIHFDWTKCKN